MELVGSDCMEINTMGPKPSQPQSGELFRPRLDEQINMRHPLAKLAALIDWSEIERTFDPEPIEDDAPDYDRDEEDSGDDCDYGDEMDGDHESALESVYGPNDGYDDGYDDRDEDPGYDD